MRKREQEELRRLEEALLESEEPEAEYQEDELDILEDTWQEASDVDYDVYNTDDTDVDLEDFSEEVYRERSVGGLSVLITVLACVLLAGLLLWLLSYMGVLE